ncbi:MAG: DEAD/DEAH box helicase family protein, partial [Candidatus Omnitrophica bacterium]|nr:DEAD/DEAH box helicase family protein [Candidatus Omnitrophota bacterium]
TTKVSDFVKTGINNAINYYRQFENFSPKGFRKATAAALKYYQKIGIQFILKKRKCILADEPGLGKTVQALGASVNAYDGKGAEKVLIVCPRVAREYVWQKQIKEHLSGDQKVFVIKTRKDLDDPRKMDKAKKARFIICSLEVIRGRSPRKSNKPDKRKKKIEETARKLREKINSLGIDFVILDEAHRIRNNSAGAKAMKDFDPDYKVLVTGTPQVGREPGKLFNLLNWMNRKKFPDKDDFKNKFLDGDDFSHLRDELKEHMIRRHFCDIASDLPKLNMEVKTLAMSKEQADFYKTVKNNIDKDPFIEKNKNSLFRKFMLNRAAVDTALIPKIEFTCTTTGKRIKYVPGYSHIDFGEVKYKIEMSRQKRGKILLKTKKTIITVGDDDKIKVKDNIYHVSIKQRKSFSAKYQALDAIIGDVVKKKKRKIVVFTGIVDVVKDLDKKYRLEGYKVKSIYGGILKERDQMIKDFNASTEPEILICTYQTLGECINLTGASDAVLIDQPWLVQERDQIVRRLYRLGQKRQVNFYALESSETEDRRREEALMEGDMLQKLLLDDPEAKDRKGIIKKFLATSGKIDEKLLENKLKSLYEEEKDKKKKPDIEEAKLFNEMYEKDLNIQFKNHSFKAILKTTSDGMVEINSIPELLVNAHMLSEASKEFLKRFFIKRLTFEEKQHFKPKDMMVWHICAEMIPGFRDVDYNARIELVIRIGTYILQRIIERPEDKDIAKKLGSDARDMFDETMYYLENAKILKLFSFIGIIPQTYYYKGALVRYVPPLKMYYAQNGIFYYDEQRAELISPNWRVPDENIPDHITGFDRDVLRVRKLTLEEEKGHARELAMFNKTSEEVLVGATLRKIKPIVGAVKKKLKKRFKASFVNAIEMKEFWDIGCNILVDLINKYAELEVYEHETLQEYVFNDRLFMRIYFWARNVRMKELETESQKGSLTIRDDSARGSLGLEEKDGINVLKQLLLKNNFSTKEVAIVENYLYGGETAETLAESTQLNQAEDKFTSEDAKETIKKFHKFMDLLGEKQTRQILEKGLSYPDTSSSDETLSTIELTKSFEDIEMQKLERRIDSIDCRSNEVLAVAGQIDLEKDEKKKYLINFVIDIDLFCAENIHLEKDIDILVKLILKYKDKKNINFIFEKFKFNKQKRRVPFAAKKESFEKGIFDKHQIVDLVKEKLTRDKNFNGQDINCMELISDRIRTERLPNINIQNLEIVEVPLITGKKAHR